MGETGGDMKQDVIRPLLGVLLTADQAAERLGRSKDSIYRAARAGQVPGATRVGKRYQFRAWELETWLWGWWDGKGSWADWADRAGIRYQPPDFWPPGKAG